MNMTATDWVGCIAVIVWLSGVGVLAHAIPAALKAAEDPFIDTAMSIFPEGVAVLMSIVIVSWPLSVPALIIMMPSRKKR
jgi:hypothetical protein